MSKDRDLIFDMTEDPEVLTYPAVDNEPLQLGGVGDDASAAADRQATTPGDVHVAPQMPAPIDGTLRQFALRVPSVIDECSGIMVFGKRIKSLVFSTDLCIIRNVNADAVFAVYPFTPQPVITQALLMASDLPVFVGVGGGLTTGKRVVNLAMYAEMQGATGVVVNAPTPRCRARPVWSSTRRRRAASSTASAAASMCRSWSRWPIPTRTTATASRTAPRS